MAAQMVQKEIESNKVRPLYICVSVYSCLCNTWAGTMLARWALSTAVSTLQVVVFSKTYCPYCTQAKQALDAELGRGKYKVIEIENRSDTAEIQQYLQKITGARTVPRVFIGGEVA